jgi:hypothetical protein
MSTLSSARGSLTTATLKPMQNGRGGDRGHADGRAGARGHGAVSVGLRWLLLRSDKGIAAAGIERGDVHLLRPMPHFPAEHLSGVYK